MHFKAVFKRFGAGVLFGCILTHSQPGKRFLTPHKPVKRYLQLRNSYQRKPKTGATPKTSPGATARRGAGNPPGGEPGRGIDHRGAQPLPATGAGSRGAARPQPAPVIRPGFLINSRFPTKVVSKVKSRKQSRKSKTLPKVGRVSKS